MLHQIEIEKKKLEDMKRIEKEEKIAREKEEHIQRTKRLSKKAGTLMLTPQVNLGKLKELGPGRSNKTVRKSILLPQTITTVRSFLIG